ncbi:THO complex subunit 2-like protein isoform X4 [Oratosquilla oratoria]|uniref:THO complex subunit 2-like protein isoform X4 n=1 Tax=Oratosquilla oratoria TaxID=337810 RepID=UPI003F761EBE
MANAYRLFTADTWKNWDKSGKAEFIQTIKQLLGDGTADPGLSYPGETKDITRAFYEIVWAIVKGHLRRDYGCSVLTEILGMHGDFSSQLVEVLTVVDLEVSTMEKYQKQREHLILVIKALNLDKLLKERMEIETLGEAGVVKAKKTFHTKQIKLKTKLFYKQQKFNLLREESEGYAKLITELNQDITSSVTPQSIIQVIRSLIGCFNLDPNRVLDLILESFECRPEQSEFYTGLLHQFPCESATISELLGFKLNNYVENQRDAKGIYTILALLIQANILNLNDIYVWLTPEDVSMIQDHQRDDSEAKEMARKADVISTKDKEKDKESNMRDKDEEEKDKQRIIEKFISNQKLQLCVTLLEVGDWDHFLEISLRFPDYYIVSSLPVTRALCKLCHITIEPIYRRSCNLPKRIKGRPEEALINPLAIPQAKTLDDVVALVFPMVSALGPFLHQDPGLMYKILRVVKRAFKEVRSMNQNLRVVKKAFQESPVPRDGEKNSFYYEFLGILDESFLPALSLMEANPCVAEEVWDTIKTFPYQHRYKLYSRWKNECYNTHPLLLRRKTALMKTCKFFMMRITKETVKPTSRVIAKLTHNNPGPVFQYILLQVQLYDNLIIPVVDSLKYLTSLSYDVLSYCLVELVSESKDRIANDSMGIAPWLQSLSAFCGAAFKKYNMELSGMLQFVANQLKAEKSIDLLILREIVQKMGGTDSMEDLTAEKLDAMCGGELLRREAGQYFQERNIKRSSLRLKEALIEHDLAIPLILLMAQQRSSVVYNQTESPHLKLVGKLYDQCQDTMVQFGSYLSQILSVEELHERLPQIGSLLSEYHINADVAFFLARPLFTHLVNSKYDDLRRQEKKLDSEQKKLKYIEACNEIFIPIVNSIRPHYSIKVWEDMDPSFFLTFWTLTMSDLEVPHHMYAKEIKKLTDQINHTNKLPKEDMPSNKRKKETERLTSLRDKLQEEEKRQKEHVERIYARLKQEKDHWFMLRTARTPKNDTITAFLQLCLFPRCTFTFLDAMYCAKFVQMLHNLKTPNFSTLICYDRLFCDITYTVASCTEQEAQRYGRFLLGTLETVMHWHSSRENYEKECANYPGFVTKYRVSKQEANDYVDYENYRHVVHKWHYKVTKALVMCLESGDYIQIRNTILILQAVSPKFPAITNLAGVIEKRIEKVKQEERSNRNDLYVLANSYSGRLKAMKSVLILESEFHIVTKKKVEPKPEGNISQVSSPSLGGTSVGDKENSSKDSKAEPSSNGPKSEAAETANGDIEIRDEKEEKKAAEARNSKEKDKEGSSRRFEEVDGRSDVEDKVSPKEEKDKGKEKERKDEKEKSRKRMKDGKKNKDEEDWADEEKEAERESSVASNTSSTSTKMEPPSDSYEPARGSKRRKTEQSSKSRNKDEGASRKEHKHKERSKSREPEENRESKKEKKDRKRVCIDRAHDEGSEVELKRKKAEERGKSSANGRSEEERKERHRGHKDPTHWAANQGRAIYVPRLKGNSDEYYDRYEYESRTKEWDHHEHRDHHEEREYGIRELERNREYLEKELERNRYEEGRERYEDKKNYSSRHKKKH